MDIACAIDNEYIRFCTVFLTSLFENNRNERITVHVLYENLDECVIQKIKTVGNKYKQIILFHKLPYGILKDFLIDSKSHITVSTYNRFFLPRILSENIHKILYLDCDIIVRKPLSDLWNINIENVAIGCVEDIWSTSTEHYKYLQYDQSYSYFNAGVLLINLDYWRKHKIETLLLNYIKSHFGKLMFNDQDALNAILYNQKILIPFKWNMQEGFYRRIRTFKSASIEIDNELADPAILHFTGRKKPWLFYCSHPLKQEFYKYQELTEWKGTVPATPIKFLIIKHINKALKHLKIMGKKYRI